MKKLKKEIERGLDFHIFFSNKSSKILQGDEIIFKALFDNRLKSIKEYEELDGYFKSKIYKELQADNFGIEVCDEKLNAIDEKTVEIINLIDNDFIKNELLYLNQGKKKQLRGNIILSTLSTDEYTLSALMELFHLATLIQDDVFDKANYRRFKKTINSRYGNKTAILVSDSLLITIILELKRFFQDSFGSEKVNNELIKHCETLTYNLISNLLLSEKIGKQVHNLEEYEQYAMFKTANLFAYGVETAYLIEHKESVDHEKLKILKQFAKEYGMIFQKIDDLLDYKDDFKLAGKDGKDKENKITNYIYLMLKNNTYEQVLTSLKREVEKLYSYEFSENYKKEINLLKRGLNV